MEQTNRQKSLVENLRNMKVGSCMCFPIRKLSSVRTTINRLSLEQNITYKTRSIRESRTLLVERTK